MILALFKQFRQKFRVQAITLSLAGIVLADVGTQLTFSLPNVVTLLAAVGWAAWILGFMVLIKEAWQAVKYIVLTSLHHKTFLTLSLLAILFPLIISWTFFPTAISGETTQELGCALAAVQTPTLGWNSTCLFGYPLRQFLPSLMTTAIFGRSQLGLNLGTAIFSLMALSIWSRGLFSYWKKSPNFDLVSASSLGLLLQSHHFIWFLFLNYEQSIMPVLFTTIWLGQMMWYRQTPSTATWFSVLMAVMATYAYTPGLALVALIICGLGYHLWRVRFRSLSLILGLMVVLLELAFSFLFRGDIHLGDQPEFNLIFQNLWEGLKALSAGHETLLTGLSFYLCTTGIVLMLWRKWSWTQMIAILWVIICLGAAILLKGYATYEHAFRLHRALVALPILFFVVLDTFHSVLNRQVLIIMTCLILTSTGVILGKTLNSRPPQPHFNLISQLQELSRHDQKFAAYLKKPSQIYIHESLKDEFIGLNDELVYFYPHLRSDLHADEFGPFCSDRSAIYLHTTTDQCLTYWQNENYSGPINSTKNYIFSFNLN